MECERIVHVFMVVLVLEICSGPLNLETSKSGGRVFYATSLTGHCQVGPKGGPT
jgi:hypothetical protein